MCLPQTTLKDITTLKREKTWNESREDGAVEERRGGERWMRGGGEVEERRGEVEERRGEVEAACDPRRAGERMDEGTGHERPREAEVGPGSDGQRPQRDVTRNGLQPSAAIFVARHSIAWISPKQTRQTHQSNMLWLRWISIHLVCSVNADKQIRLFRLRQMPTFGRFGYSR